MAETLSPELSFGRQLYGTGTDTVSNAKRKLIWINTFDPLSVVPSVWYDPSDLSSMFQEDTGVTPAAVNSPVGKINDKSGNGKHLTQATAAARPILRTFRGLYWLELDGVDDGFFQAAVAFGASMDVAWAFYNTGVATQYLPLDSAASLTVSLAISGDAGTVNTGGGTDFINGVALAPDTRGALFTAIGSSGPKVIQGNGIDLSGFTNFRISSFPAFLLTGRFYGMLIAPAMSAANRASILTYLALKAGLVF